MSTPTTVGNGLVPRFGTTPVRALTSKITNRSAPSIPLASDVYEPLVKSLFRQRLKFVLLLSGFTTWLITSSWVLWQEGGPRMLGMWGALYFAFSPSSLLITFLTWIMVALPITVLRKAFLSENRSSATSPSAMVRTSSTQSSTRIAFIAYSCSSISALVLHIIMAYQHETFIYGDPKLTLFVKSRKHPYYLNGRLIFLLLTQAFLALTFSLRGAMNDRFAYKWPSKLTSRDNTKLIIIPVSMAVAMFFGTIATIAASILFASIRTVLPILFKIPIISMLLRPFAYHFLKGKWTIALPLFHLPLLFRAWFLAFSTFVNWELTDSVFEYVVSETAVLSTATADPNLTVISGITSKDRVFKYFAYSELRDIAVQDSSSGASRRASLFGEQQSSINLWHVLARESLLLLGSDYQLVLRRGKPAPVPSVPPIKKEEYIPKTPFATPAPVLRQRIFKVTPESPGQAALDALASDGPIAKAIDVGADATHVPELFRSVEIRVLTSPVVEEAKKNVQSAHGLGSKTKARILKHLMSIWEKYTPGHVRQTFVKLSDWWVRKRVSKVVEAALPYRELDVLVIDVLSYLVCASLQEDKYGVVQRDIPKILEAMISFLSTVEEYQIEVTALQKPSPTVVLTTQEQEERDTLAIEIQKAQDILGLVNDSLKEGIIRIVKTFDDKLLAFKFPQKVANKLQTFIDYS